MLGVRFDYFDEKSMDIDIQYLDIDILFCVGLIYMLFVVIMVYLNFLQSFNLVDLVDFENVGVELLVLEIGE